MSYFFAVARSSKNPSGMNVATTDTYSDETVASIQGIALLNEHPIAEWVDVFAVRTRAAGRAWTTEMNGGQPAKASTPSPRLINTFRR